MINVKEGAPPSGEEAAIELPSITEVEIQRLYPTPFIIVPLDNPGPLNAVLRETILDRAEVDPGVRRSNAGGWQSDADFQDWAGAPGKHLLELATQIANAVTAIQTDDGLQAGGPAWKMNAWANINAPGDANHAHHHPAAFWSGVYWIDAGEPKGETPVGGEFEMHDPRGILPAFYAPSLRYAINGCVSAGGQDFFTPKTGTLVLFPAWLVHAVRPYAGAGLRISVAFNLSV